jgi:asparagine synthase (glutamine-hydrolysing)
MCGIAGIWNYHGENRPDAAVAAMLRAMKHRGPDGTGTFDFVGGAGGMVRLALVDLSPRGQQPLWAHDKQVGILFNGEIYNFRELRAELESAGHAFQTQTDTEVVLHAYLEYDTKFVEKLRGMFAIAIFDWRQLKKPGLPKLLVARDPFGMKPLYLAQADHRPGSVIFSSEIRGLLASGLVARGVDQEAVAEYLSSGFVNQPRTMIRGVRMLERGFLEIYSPERPAQRIRFWSMPRYSPVNETLESAAERLRSVLKESVRVHALADAPVGAFLSGGVDSSAIVGMMREHISDLRTFTLRFPEFPDADEAAEAAQFAQYIGVKNQSVDILGKDVVELLPQFACDLDQPSADGLNTWLISRAAAKEVKGALSGLGGDEWFAGYPILPRMVRSTTTLRGNMLRAAGNAARVMRELPWSREKYEALSRVSARSSPIALWTYSHSLYRWLYSRRAAGLPTLGSSRERHVEEILSGMDVRWREENTIGRACLLDVGIYMGYQLLRDVDAVSMAHSLELRMPFVDIEIARFSRTCSDRWKLSPKYSVDRTYESTGAKRVLIDSIADVLPPGIAQRPKRGFALPQMEWMRTDLADLVRTTVSPSVLKARGIIDPCILPANWQEFQKPNALQTRQLLWPLMVFELWCQSVLDSSAPVNTFQSKAVVRGEDDCRVN